MQLRPKTRSRITAVFGALLLLIAGIRAIRHLKVEKNAATSVWEQAAPIAEPVSVASPRAPVSELQAGTSSGPEVIAGSEPEATGDEASALASVVDSQLADFHEGITLGQSENWQTSDDKAYVACRTYEYRSTSFRVAGENEAAGAADAAAWVISAVSFFGSDKLWVTRRCPCDPSTQNDAGRAPASSLL